MISIRIIDDKKEKAYRLCASDELIKDDIERVKRTLLAEAKTFLDELYPSPKEVIFVN